LSAYRKELVVSAVLAIIIVIGLGSFAQFAPQLISPTPTPVPMPTPTPTPMPTVTPTLGPRPKLNMTAGFASLEGFSLTKLQFQSYPVSVQSFPYPVLVLRPGGSGSIPITLISTDDRDYTVSLDIGFGVLPGKFEGVRYVFSPTTLNLKAGKEVNSILSIEADLDAPTAYYELIIYTHIKEWGGSIGMPLFDLLIYPYTPSYAFHIRAPEPGEPAPIPIPFPPPTIAVKPGETVYIMFDIYKGTSDPTVQVKIDLTYNSGSLPSGISAKFTSDPLKVVPVPAWESVIMLTLTAAEDFPEGMYRMIATITVGSYTVQIPFDLTAASKS